MENVSFKSEFDKKFEEHQKMQKRANILVAGYTGCGKSSLIKTILGDSIPESAINNSTPQELNFDEYENSELTLWDSRGLELGELEDDFCAKMQDFISERQNDINVDKHIHLVWYLIQGASARVTDSDIKLIKNVFTTDNVIVVISKKDITRNNQLEAITEVLTNAGVAEEKIIAVSDTEGGAMGCNELVLLTKQMLPSAYQDAFMIAQSIDREAKANAVAKKSDIARDIINSTIAKIEECEDFENGTALIPFEIDMIAELLALYGLRDNNVRAQAAKFVNEMIENFITPQTKEEDFEFSTNFATTFTGALGHYAKNNFEAYVIAKIKGTALPDLGFSQELFEHFYQTYRKGSKMKPNILICGKTGVGKTSLIQAVTHHGVVPDSAIGNGKPITKGFQIYETPVANFVDCEGMEAGSQSVDDYANFILDELLERLESDKAENLIHNIWYCIDGSGARIQDADEKLIRTFDDKVILVVTKCDLMRKEQHEAMMKTLLNLVDKERIIMVSAEKQTGLKQLINQAEKLSEESCKSAEEELEAFRDRWSDYYIDMFSSWQLGVEEEADSLINWATGRAAAIALIPLPLADVAPLIANEVYMIYKLAELYGKAIDETVITTILGVAGGSLIGKIGASFVPVLKIPIAAGVTYGVGKAAKLYFESEMTLSTYELKNAFKVAEREAKKQKWTPIEKDGE